MDFMTSLDISASALRATKTRINVASMNLANIQTTRTREGGPYRKRVATIASQSLDNPVSPKMESEFMRELQGVRVTGIVRENVFTRKYDPSHPDADTEGYVTLPDINPIEEMANLMNLQRLYEANTTAIEVAKSMYMKALEIGS
ncbi:MAG: flagellar basal body rod protein FlgC [Desulfovibrionaceae bacterium]|nr:flagellar basal body rod protein FlgC [Desulfovibrionaceae bacterium]